MFWAFVYYRVIEQNMVHQEVNHWCFYMLMETSFNKIMFKVLQMRVLL